MAITPDEAMVIEAPTGTAIRSYTMLRLGEAPSVAITVAETVPDTVALRVVAMTLTPESTEEAWEWGGVQVAGVDATAGLVGQELRLADDTLVGVVASVTTGSLVTFEDPVATDLTDEVLYGQRANPFGVPALRCAKELPSRTLYLTSGEPTQFGRMATLMFTAHVNAVLAALPGLGVTKTTEEVQAAVLGAVENLESILATAFEALELERRAGTFVGTIGSVGLLA